jgi:hypothetical protein
MDGKARLFEQQSRAAAQGEVGKFQHGGEV